jgi:alanine dehydrogenase
MANRTRVLSTRDVKQLLTMEDCLAVQEQVFAQNARGVALNYENAWSYADPETMRFPATGKMMSGRIEPNRWGMKVYGAREGAADDRARMQILSIFDSETLLPVALLEANYLGHLRTGAGAGVASKFLARPESRVLGVIGTGATARFATFAHAAAKWAFDEVLVYSRNPESRERFAAQVSAATGYRVTPCDSPEGVVSSADILITGTASHQPAFDADWVQPGTHVNAMGQRQEIPPALFQRAYNVADEVAIAIADGKLSCAIRAGAITAADAHASLGEVISGMKAGRIADDQVTVFDSSGICVQDIAAAMHVIGQAETQNVGTMVEFHHDDPLWEGE